jgi:hypothetical protein
MPIPSGFQPLADWRLANQLGPINGDAPFQPLGALPVCGASLMVESAELLTRDWDAVVIVIDWAQPQGGFDFADWYAAYNAKLGRPVFSDEAFRVQASIQTPSGWEAMEMSDDRLFQRVAGQDDWVPRFVLQRAQVSGLPVVRPSVGVKEPGRGCIRLELSSPTEAFGHGLYAGVLQAVMAAHATSQHPELLTLPNPPFVPLARSLRVGIRWATRR